MPVSPRHEGEATLVRPDRGFALTMRFLKCPSSKRLSRLLGIQHPILLAPMGSAAGGRLAAAVTNAGGLGLVGSGYANVDAVRNELSEAGTGSPCDFSMSGTTIRARGFVRMAMSNGNSTLKGLIHWREASINDVPIREGDRLFRWPSGPRPADHPGLTELGLWGRQSVNSVMAMPWHNLP